MEGANLVLRWLHSRRRAEPWLNGILTIDDGAIILPNGTKLQYTLRHDGENYYRTDRRGTTKIWGSALTGEVIQTLASVYLREVLINIQERTGLKPCVLRHDEAVYCVRECDVELTLAQVAEEFRRPPVWLPGIPLGCDIWDSATYTKSVSR